MMIILILLDNFDSAVIQVESERSCSDPYKSRLKAAYNHLQFQKVAKFALTKSENVSCDNYYCLYQKSFILLISTTAAVCTFLYQLHLLCRVTRTRGVITGRIDLFKM